MRGAGPGLVDAHCHLGDAAFDPDREAVLARARDADVHPHEARHWSPAAAARLRDLLALPEVVALGETGLDYHYEHSPRDAQRDAFEAQLKLAAEVRKPVVVHAREADDDMVAMLRDVETTVVLHSFSSGPGVFEAGVGVSP